MNLSTHARTGRRRAAGLLALAATVSLVVSACGSSSTSNSGKGLSNGELAKVKATAVQAQAAPRTISETTPLTKKPAPGKLIVFIGGGTPPDAEAYAGIQEAAKLLGWQAKLLTFNAADLSTFNSALQQALSLHADYVVDSGITRSQVSTSTLAQYASAHVPIIAYNVTPVTQKPPFVSLYGGEAAFTQSGVRLANWFIADSDGRGKVLNVNITAYPILTAFADSFDREVKKTCPSCSTQRLSQTFSDLANGKIASNVIAKLRADRSIKYVVFDNSAENNGLDAALRAAGITDVKSLGFAIDPATVRSVKSGYAKAFDAYNFRYNGWAAVDAAARLSLGEPATNPKSVTPLWLITDSNVDQLPSNALFRGPDNALEQFAKLWQVSAS